MTKQIFSSATSFLTSAYFSVLEILTKPLYFYYQRKLAGVQMDGINLRDKSKKEVVR